MTDLQSLDDLSLWVTPDVADAYAVQLAAATTVQEKADVVAAFKDRASGGQWSELLVVPA